MRSGQEREKESGQWTVESGWARAPEWGLNSGVGWGDRGLLSGPRGQWLFPCYFNESRSLVCHCRCVCVYRASVTL